MLSWLGMLVTAILLSSVLFQSSMPGFLTFEPADCQKNVWLGVGITAATGTKDDGEKVAGVTSFVMQLCGECGVVLDEFRLVHSIPDFTFRQATM